MIMIYQHIRYPVELSALLSIHSRFDLQASRYKKSMMVMSLYRIKSRVAKYGTNLPVPYNITLPIKDYYSTSEK